MNQFPWTKDEASLIKRLWDDPGGRRALMIVIDRIGAASGQSFVPGDTHATAFNEGRRWVARQLMTAIETPIETLVPKEPDGSRNFTATERVERIKSGRDPFGRAGK